MNVGHEKVFKKNEQNVETDIKKNQDTCRQRMKTQNLLKVGPFNKA